MLSGKKKKKTVTMSSQGIVLAMKLNTLYYIK